MNIFSKPQAILIVSNEPWGDIWFSKHNYAFELSRFNSIFFINPTKKWNPGNIFRCKITERKISENLTVLEYHNRLPSFFYRFNNLIISNSIRKYLLKKGITRYWLWSFDPYRLSNPAALRADFCILHLVDRYLLTHPAEQEILNQCNAIIGVSKKVLYDDLLNKPYAIIPHGIASEEFEADEAKISQLKNQYGNLFGLYVGMINFRLDFEAIEQLLIQFPETPFVFIGQDQGFHSEAYKRVFSEKKYKNLILTGPKPFKELKHYISAATFCLSPMKLDVPGNAISHHKIFQYLAMGKPVMCPEFSEYSQISHLFKICNSTQAYITAVKEILMMQEPPELRQQRIDYAGEHTFEVHLNNISLFLEQTDTSYTRS